MNIHFFGGMSRYISISIDWDADKVSHPVSKYRDYMLSPLHCMPSGAEFRNPLTRLQLFANSCSPSSIKS
jgi:hypothetical protein